MALKSLVVFIEPSSIGDLRVRYAVELARRHRAHLIGVFVQPKAWDTERSDEFIRGADAVRSMMARHDVAEHDALVSAEACFAREAGHDTFTHEFQIIRDDDADDRARMICLHTDLVIAGHPEPGGLPKAWSPERMLIATGIPFLIVPNEWPVERVATNILLAWNGSREARRAVNDALPFLIAAQSVAVVIVNSETNSASDEHSGAEIANFLLHHGVEPHVEHLGSRLASIADVILDYAVRNRSDLIVIGACSHSKTRELLFGGVTRSLLRSVTIPTLIAH